MWSIYLGGVLLQHTDGLRVNGCGLGLKVRNSSIRLDGQDGVGLGHMHRVVDVGGAAVFQLHLLQAGLVVRICTEPRRRMEIRIWALVQGQTLDSDFAQDGRRIP